MRLSLAATAATLFAAANARITGIAVPETIKPGDTFDVVIESSNYIQTVYDVAIAFGYAPGKGYPDSLFNVVGSFYLGPEESNQLHNFNKTVTVPSTATKGEGVFSAGLYSLYGASSGTTLSNYNVSVTFGDKTSKKYKSSSA
ncbi:hypothetical protein B0T10DRAFT_274512 [Thelonectria olida]|uniref:Secreted protein NIS1 n=1 Tax=Thelonectria olida TaxID=1576542 RepID=A0A9P8WAD5_9HYPO|nr:hypothetical protein B0T10DRAFT_274512 [Thelonectria olida]